MAEIRAMSEIRAITIYIYIFNREVHEYLAVNSVKEKKIKTVAEPVG